MLVLANPHNPTGRVPSHQELAELAERCAERGVWVLADEIHAPLTLAGARHTPWLEVSDAAREYGIALTSASKAFNLAGLKAALVVTASDRARAAVARLPPLSDRAGLLGVIAAEAAFNDGDEWLDAVLAQLDANRAQLGQALRALPGIAWTPPDATYLAWLDCRALGLGDEPAGDVPGSRTGRVQPRPGLRPAGRRARAAELRHQPGAAGRDRAPDGGDDRRQLTSKSSANSLPATSNGPAAAPCTITE